MSKRFFLLQKATLAGEWAGLRVNLGEIKLTGPQKSSLCDLVVTKGFKPREVAFFYELNHSTMRGWLFRYQDEIKLQGAGGRKPKLDNESPNSTTMFSKSML